MRHTHQATARDRGRAAPAIAAQTGLCASSHVLTMTGQVPVQALQPGNRVISRTTGAVTIQGIRCATYSGPLLRLMAGALGQERPAREVLLPPGQKLLLRDRPGELVTACELEDDHTCQWHQTEGPVTLHQLEFTSPQIIYADGLELDCS